MNMKRISIIRSLFLFLALTLRCRTRLLYSESLYNGGLDNDITAHSRSSN